MHNYSCLVIKIIGILPKCGRNAFQHFLNMVISNNEFLSHYVGKENVDFYNRDLYKSLKLKIRKRDIAWHNCGAAVLQKRLTS